MNLLQEMIDLLQEKVFDVSQYDWYVYMDASPMVLSRRGKGISLKKASVFGVRRATSADAWRVIQREKGASIIASIDSATKRKLVAASQPATPAQMPKELSESKLSDVEAKHTPPKSLFAEGSAGEIAKWAIASHRNLKDAIASLTFYENRAGKKLSAERRDALDQAKKAIHGHFQKHKKVKEAIELVEAPGGTIAVQELCKLADGELEFYNDAVHSNDGLDFDEIVASLKAAAKKAGKTIYAGARGSFKIHDSGARKDVEVSTEDFE